MKYREHEVYKVYVRAWSGGQPSIFRGRFAGKEHTLAFRNLETGQMVYVSPTDIIRADEESRA